MSFIFPGQFPPNPGTLPYSPTITAGGTLASQLSQPRVDIEPGTTTSFMRFGDIYLELVQTGPTEKRAYLWVKGQRALLPPGSGDRMQKLLDAFFV